MNNIVIKDVNKTYDGKTYALKNINLEIKNGMFGILGRNGSGKSTLMNMLSTILQQSSGTIEINNISLTQTKQIRKMIGYLPQDFDFYPNMKVKETLYYLGFLSGIPKANLKINVAASLEKVNLVEHQNKKVKSLSGGMKKRLGIAQAIIHNPQVLIVDEPTAGLDPEERVRLRHLLSNLAKDKIVIISTHIVSDIESTCENIAILDKGVIAYKGSIKNLIELSDNKVYEITISPSKLNQLKKNNIFITKIQEYEHLLKVRFVSESNLEGTRKVKQDFEDAYMYFLKMNQGGKR
ncbi:ABC transporter ATP-binding protein [Staphylococcus lugdunensis]|uniref:ABC transporter ATP-binding protein n=1 Tax=Staphylococcus TaxID=1279 RepID=UPI0008A60871|nr:MULTISPECIES: ABC transporter ATP-binding protein [Staphylococcus]ARJ12758.1 ABC transporter ATP-binding protein [Staphylococcus lugdunensis]MCH8664926.1 ABC transporter ATP-binding protein [Staphylococcus lugdunensis]OFJ61529.1 ABC transporter ATP-binding protein [Staphylococcus sp. HMSC077E11]OFM46696.1 ABC transporter ATP-binding protein [Staphylococcus sp. HMSC077E12]OFR90075.1 ABC transporter ATP-binding protein [Staphylococcus sp. HMSC059F04]